jgi:predicted TIM-barrel fold metal-dependent hydrolase
VQRALETFMLREIGLTAADLDGDFDRLYVERLLALVRDAGLSRVLLLAQEDVYSENGDRMPGRGAFYVPNERVLALAREHPEFVPAVSIHPARRDALEELERCLEGGAAVMKCLPNCQNIDPALPRYRRFWERMAEARLPLLAHTGGEKVLPEIRRDLANPRVHAVPLEIGVTVIAAHCGTSSSKSADNFPAFLEMLAKYPRLYGDISALSFPRKPRHLARMLQPGVVERLIHGSDFPVPVQPLWMWLGGKLSWREYRRLRRIRNPLARDVAIKRALGFPEATFSRIEEIWRPPR